MNDLLPDVRRKLRELTHAYLLRPDPVSWMVAADLLEESGMDEEAALWRRRAEWFHDIQAEVKACLDEMPLWYRYYIGPSRRVAVGGFLVNMRRKRLSLRVWVRQPLSGGLTQPLPVGHLWHKGSFWRLNVMERERYFNEKVIGLIDDLHNNPL